MTFPLFEAFQAEWRLRPPVHWLAGAFMGYKPKAYDGPKAGAEAKAADGARPKGGGGGRSLKRDFPGGVIR